MPLLRDKDVRAVVAVILVIDGLVVAGGTWISMLWLPYPLMLLLVPGAIVRCRVVEGRTRSEVRALLGRPDGGTRTWRWSVGWTNDFLGPGDGQDFLVAFGRDGRAGRGSLTYSEWS